MYRVLCSHPKDLAKVSKLELILLSIIASHRSTGILQTDLVTASGQNYRSVRKSTDRLARDGYIERRAVDTKNTVGANAKTSKLVHHKYVSRGTQELVFQAHHTADVGETGVNNVFIVFQPTVKSLFDMLRTERLLRRGDLEAAIHILDPWQISIFARLIRDFEIFGCLELVPAASDHIGHLIWKHDFNDTRTTVAEAHDEPHWLADFRRLVGETCASAKIVSSAETTQNLARPAVIALQSPTVPESSLATVNDTAKNSRPKRVRKVRRYSPDYTPSKAERPKLIAKQQASRNTNEEQRLHSKTELKYMRGTEKFWSTLSPTGKIHRASRIEMAHSHRPKFFDNILIRALEHGLPIPCRPEDATQAWVDRTINVLARKEQGLYITLSGEQPNGWKRLRHKSCIVILRSRRLSEVDFTNRRITAPVRFLASSVSHTFPVIRYNYFVSNTPLPMLAQLERPPFDPPKPDTITISEPTQPRGPKLGVFFDDLPPPSVMRLNSFIPVPATAEDQASRGLQSPRRGQKRTFSEIDTSSPNQHSPLHLKRHLKSTLGSAVATPKRQRLDSETSSATTASVTTDDRHEQPVTSEARSRSQTRFDSPPPARASNARQACEACRKRRTRCSGHRPQCTLCVKSKSNCIYATNSTSPPPPLATRITIKTKTATSPANTFATEQTRLVESASLADVSSPLRASSDPPPSAATFIPSVNRSEHYQHAATPDTNNVDMHDDIELRHGTLTSVVRSQDGNWSFGTETTLPTALTSDDAAQNSVDGMLLSRYSEGARRLIEEMMAEGWNSNQGPLAISKQPMVRTPRPSNVSASRRLGILCRKIITDLLEKCDGALPFNIVPLLEAYSAAWSTAGEESIPDQATIKAAFKSMTDGGKARLMTFTFQDMMGAMVKSTILCRPGMNILHPVVSSLRKKIIECHPEPYIPPELNRHTSEVRQENQRRSGRQRRPSRKKIDEVKEHAILEHIQFTASFSTSRLGNQPVRRRHSKRLEVISGLPPRRTALARKRLCPHAQTFASKPAVFAPIGGVSADHLPFDVDSSNGPPKDSLVSTVPPTRRRKAPAKSKIVKLPVPLGKIVWKKGSNLTRVGVLPESLEEILKEDQRIEIPDHVQQTDPAWSLFRWQVDGVTKWEDRNFHKLPNSTIWHFINHTVPDGLHIEPFEGPIRFAGMEYFNAAGAEIFLPLNSTLPRLMTEPPRTTAPQDVPEIAPTRQVGQYGLRAARPRRNWKQILDSEPNADDDQEYVQPELDFIQEGDEDIEEAKDLEDAEPMRPTKKRKRSEGSFAQPAARRRKTQNLSPAYITNGQGDLVNVSGYMNAPMKKARGAQHLRNMDLDAIYRISVTIVVVRTLCGGLDKLIDWGLVNQLFPENPEGYVYGRWKTISNKYRRDVAALTENFQDRYPKAYLAGEIPDMDFDNVHDNDWPAVVDWALKTLEKPTLKETDELPATGSELAETMSLTFEEHRGLRDLLGYNGNSTIPARENAQASIPFAIPTPSDQQPFHLVPPPDDPLLTTAKSWALASILTPSSTFNSSAANAKLSALAPTKRASESLFDAALRALLVTKAIANQHSKKHVRSDISGRTYAPSKAFWDALDERRTVKAHLLKQAARYKRQVLDAAFASGEKSVVFDAQGVEDGDMVCVLNMLAHGRMKLGIGDDVPRRRYGLEDRGYETRKLDKSRLWFSVLIEATDTYVSGNPIKEMTLPLPMPEDGDEKANLPIWVDINGALQRKIWELVVGAVVGLVSTRPGIRADEVQKTLTPALTLWEVETVLKWLQGRGCIAVSGGGMGMGWETKEWWWLVLGGCA